MELFVLVDLIGSQQSTILNYFPSATNHVYQLLAKIEKLLVFNNMLVKRNLGYFNDFKGNGRNHQVEDDHKPFLSQKVPILHIIPHPFPRNWHQAGDLVENLNQHRIQDMRLIMKYFLIKILKVNTKNKS